MLSVYWHTSFVLLPKTSVTLINGSDIFSTKIFLVYLSNSSIFSIFFFRFIFKFFFFWSLYFLYSITKKVHVNLFIQKCIKSKGSYDGHNKNTKTGRHATILLPIFLYIFIYVDRRSKKQKQTEKQKHRQGRRLWTPALRLERILMHKQMAKANLNLARLALSSYTRV